MSFEKQPSMNAYWEYMRRPETLFVFHQGEMLPRAYFKSVRIAPEETNDNNDELPPAA